MNGWGAGRACSGQRAHSPPSAPPATPFALPHALVQLLAGVLQHAATPAVQRGHHAAFRLRCRSSCASLCGSSHGCGLAARRPQRLLLGGRGWQAPAQAMPSTSRARCVAWAVPCQATGQQWQREQSIWRRARGGRVPAARGRPPPFARARPGRATGRWHTAALSLDLPAVGLRSVRRPARWGDVQRLVRARRQRALLKLHPAAARVGSTMG